MAKQSFSDCSLANTTVVHSSSGRTHIGSQLALLAKGKKIAIRENKIVFNIYNTVGVLPFKDDFNKKMFYRTLSVIAQDERFSGIQLTGPWLQLLFTAFKKAANKELDELTIKAIHRGSDFTVLFNDLIEHYQRKPRFSHLSIYWKMQLQVLADVIVVKQPDPNYWIPDVEMLAGHIIKHKDNISICSRRYRQLLLELKQIPLEYRILDKSEFNILNFIVRDKYYDLRMLVKRAMTIKSENPMLEQFLYGLWMTAWHEFGKRLRTYPYRRQLLFSSEFFVIWLKFQYPTLYLFLIKEEKRNHFKEANFELEQLMDHMPICFLVSIRYLINHPDALRLFHYLYQGMNIRKYDQLPFPLTRKMAHVFHTELDTSTTLDNMMDTVFVKAFGGNSELARNISEYGPSIRDNYDFVRSIVLFFAKYPKQNPENYHRILEYIRYRYDTDTIPFSFKGRTLESIGRQARQYQNDLVRRQRMTIKNSTWNGMDVDDWNKFIDGQWYAIFQLKSYQELEDEGYSMRNCVREYAMSCVMSRTFIFSLRVKSGNIWKSKVTIELSIYKRIVQYKSFANQKPNSFYLDMIQEWADREGLEFYTS